MLSTHTPKIFNARIKSTALVANIIHALPEHIISSQSVNLRKKYWAAPLSAADMRKWKIISENTTNDMKLNVQIPDLTDPYQKQILMPADWKKDQYVTVTPVASMGLINELYHRLKEQNLPFRRWTIQPNPLALVNHGEALMMQSGSLRMLRRGVIKNTEPSQWQGTFIKLTAYCQRMNISSGMVSVGFPAITGIGGFIHSLERKINSEIEFAFGLESMEWVSGVPKITLNKSGSSSTSGRTKGNAKVTPVPSYMTDEITGNGHVVLLLRTKGSMEELAAILQNTTRLASGSLFNTTVEIIHNDKAPNINYIQDASSDLNNFASTQNDNLQKALDLYAINGYWKEYQWIQPKEHQYIINQTGYAFLEEPNTKELSRNNYPHAWVEPVFTLINQKPMSESAWWTRESTPAGFFWKGVALNEN